MSDEDSTRAALPHLRETKGSIVNIGSVSSMGGGWKHAGYNTAKAAVANLTRPVACDNGKFGVRANTVRPGLTITGMVDAIMDDATLLEKAWERIPLRRAGKPEEVASAIASRQATKHRGSPEQRSRSTAARSAPMSSAHTSTHQDADHASLQPDWTRRDRWQDASGKNSTREAGSRAMLTHSARSGDDATSLSRRSSRSFLSLTQLRPV